MSTPRAFLLDVPAPRGIRPERRTLHVSVPAHCYVPRVLETHGLRGYEPESTSVALALTEGVAGRRWFYDVGANVGLFSWLVRVACPDLGVVAFEPTPDLAATARTVLGDNRLGGEVEELALGSSAGAARLYLSNTSDASNSLNQDFRRVERYVEVELSTLDAYVESTDRIPALVKIDTESTEPDVVRGGLRTLTEHRPWIICEVLGRGGGPQLTSLLEPLGYTFHPIDDRLPLRRRSLIVGEQGEHRNWLFAPAPITSDLLDRIAAWRSALQHCGPRTSFVVTSPPTSTARGTTRAGRLARRACALLPPPRDQAALALLGDVRDLITGHPPRRGPR